MGDPSPAASALQTQLKEFVITALWQKLPVARRYPLRIARFVAKKRPLNTFSKMLLPAGLTGLCKTLVGVRVENNVWYERSRMCTDFPFLSITTIQRWPVWSAVNARWLIRCEPPKPPPPPARRVGWAWAGGLHHRVSLQRIPLPGKVRSGWSSGTTAITSAAHLELGVMSSGKPHQSQDLPTWSCGLVARPWPCASCLGLCTTLRVPLTLWHKVGPAVLPLPAGERRYSTDC